MTLKKEIGLLEATSIMVGVMIGSGIFVSPVSITANCGSIGLSLIVWVLSGFLMLAVALCYVELAGLFPFAGGEYNFYKCIYGVLPGFLFSWLMFSVLSPAFLTLLALTTANYLIQPWFVTCQMPVETVRMLTVAVLLTVAGLNSMFLKYVARVQTFFFFAKVLALVIISITGIVQLCRGKVSHLQTGFEGTTSNPGNVAVAMYSGVFTYNGWQYLFMLMEEVKNPEKVVPRATFLSFFITIIVYFFTNVAYFTVMSPAQMMKSPAVAVEFSEATLGRFSIIVPFFVACSTVGALNASFLGGSRLYFATARDKLFPSIISMVHPESKVPLASVWITFLMCVLYVTYDNAVSLIEYLGFVAGGLLSMTSICALLVMRYRKPHTPRIVKLPLPVPVLALVVIILLNGLALYQAPVQNGIGVLMIASGIPVYWAGVCWTKPRGFQRLFTKFVHMCQKTLHIIDPSTAEETT